MAMPEAAMHEDCRLIAWDHQIRTARKSPIVDAEPEPGSMEIAPDEQFSFRVSSANPRHHPRTLLWSDDVGQLEAPALLS